MLRFPRMKTLQNFASVHASVHNHFRRSATSSIEPRTSRDARPPWPSGEGFAIRLTAPSLTIHAALTLEWIYSVYIFRS